LNFLIFVLNFVNFIDKKRKVQKIIHYTYNCKISIMQMAKFLTDNVRLVTNIVKVRSTLKLVREWKSGGQNNDSIE